MSDTKNDSISKLPNFFEYQEFLRIKKIFDQNPNSFWKFEIGETIQHQEINYPLWKIICENENSQKPANEKTTLLISAGVHGLERIGSQLCLSLLEKYLQLSQWDQLFLKSLDDIRIVFIPFVNPVGIDLTTRSNGSGVDLMRNSPIEAEDKVPFLAGGHRHGSWLPWFRGKADLPMEKESVFLIETTATEMHKSKFGISLDIHSGVGWQDQIWFPWAFTKRPFNQLDFVTHMMQYFENLFPFHVYKIEPQSQVYCAHGDLWDYLLCHPLKEKPYIPLTLELGSWLWIKKNPLQIFNLEGLFHPIKKHRIKRILRRHQLFIDFLIRYLVYLNQNELDQKTREEFYNKGLQKWYPHLKKI